MNALEETKERERKARRHGRHITLEQELNRIGLSLFAPPFGNPGEERVRMVTFNDWESVQAPTTQYITIYCEGANIHKVTGIPPNTIIEFRRTGRESLASEETETIDGETYYVRRFADE